MKILENTLLALLAAPFVYIALVPFIVLARVTLGV